MSNWATNDNQLQIEINEIETDRKLKQQAEDFRLEHDGSHGGDCVWCPGWSDEFFKTCESRLGETVHFEPAPQRSYFEAWAQALYARAVALKNESVAADVYSLQHGS